MSDFYSELNEGIIGTVGKTVKGVAEHLKPSNIKHVGTHFDEKVGDMYRKAGNAISKPFEGTSQRTFWKNAVDSNGELRDKTSKIADAYAKVNAHIADNIKKAGNVLGDHPRVATAGIAGAGTGTGIGAYLANKSHDAKDAVKSAGESVKSALADHPKTAAAIGAATAAGLGALALRKKLASKKK